MPDLHPERFDLGLGFGVGAAIALFELLVEFLQCVKDTRLTSRFGKNLGDQGQVIDPHVGHDHLEVANE